MTTSRAGKRKEMSAPYAGLKELPYKGLRGKKLYSVLAINQRAWIEYCERNGRSYTGPNGPAIRQADLNELRRVERLSA